jgi:hypothetical protein
MGELLKGGNAVLWFVVLFLPGFLSAEVYGMMVASERPDFSKDFYQAVAFSILNFAAFAPLIYWMFTAKLFGELWVAWVTTYLVLIVAPIGWAFLMKWLRDQPWTPFLFCDNKAWDYFFAHKEPVWVVAHMNDGNTVGGFYAGDSYASSYPSEEQIYIQQQWLLGENDEFIKPVDQSAGVLLNARDVKTFEFYEFTG